MPPGPLIAIWGMETGFGAVRGRQNMLSAIATLAYDCRRTEYFTDQLYAALKLIDQGVFHAGTISSMHGEVGQTQFMPKNVLLYGNGGNLEDSSAALNVDGQFPAGRMAGARARATSPASRISRPSRNGTRRASISAHWP